MIIHSTSGKRRAKASSTKEGAREVVASGKQLGGQALVDQAGVVARVQGRARKSAPPIDAPRGILLMDSTPAATTMS